MHRNADQFQKGLSFIMRRKKCELTGPKVDEDVDDKENVGAAAVAQPRDALVAKVECDRYGKTDEVGHKQK